MERISVRNLASAIRLIREPVVVTYSYPRNDPRYERGSDGSPPGEELGVFLPMAEYRRLVGDPDSGARSPHDA